MQIFWLFMAGGAGSVCRFLLASRLRGLPLTFPYGTLTVNVIGSLLIGILMTALASRFLAQPIWQTTLITGFLGGFTTFSAFSYESLYLLQTNTWLGLVNILANVVVCIGAAGLGVWAMRMML